MVESLSMTAPSLLAPSRSVVPTHTLSAPVEAKTLLDLMYEGFYMLFLLRNRYGPADAEGFRGRLRDFLLTVERGGRRLDLPSEDVYLAKYAFCALVDERVLMSQEAIRPAWERNPMQLEMFGEQLAGQHFFDKLEQLRHHGASKLQALEVFHMCLLMGFQGKYLIEGSEKLGYLTARLGDEIAQLKGKRAEFAPHWQAPVASRTRCAPRCPCGSWGRCSGWPACWLSWGYAPSLTGTPRQIWRPMCRSSRCRRSQLT